MNVRHSKIILWFFFGFFLSDKPTCSIEQFRNEGKVLLICKAVGNPPPRLYNWTSDEGEILDARMDDKGSNLEIEPPAATKIYNCTATNDINTSDVCFAVVEGQYFDVSLVIQLTQCYIFVSPAYTYYYQNKIPSFSFECRFIVVFQFR